LGWIFFYWNFAMKPVAKDSSNAQPQKILTALILTGIVSVGSGLTLLKDLYQKLQRNQSNKTRQLTVYPLKLLMLFCGVLLMHPTYLKRP
jgi:hypothetical protein